MQCFESVGFAGSAAGVVAAADIMPIVGVSNQQALLAVAGFAIGKGLLQRCMPEIPAMRRPVDLQTPASWNPRSRPSS